MRWVFLIGGVAVATALGFPVAPTYATPVSSQADRARIALLIYQSQSARQVDLRRGDALTKDLRTKADAAEKLAATTRLQLASARLEGSRARNKADMLARDLNAQEQALSEAAETYAAELAKRDEDYARERSILISTGERLLRTAEGRKVLDLYNAGGESNWQEARKVMDEARRVRRSVDARDSATLYLGARNHGLETTLNVIRVYEELLSDDASRSEDWRELAILYLDAGNAPKAFEAFDRAAQTASTGAEKGKILLNRAMAESGLHAGKSIIPYYDNAILELRRHLQRTPGDVAAQADLAKALVRSAEIILIYAGISTSDTSVALERLQESVKIVTGLIALNPKTDARRIFISSNKLMGDYHRLIVIDDKNSQKYYDASISMARILLSENPTSIFEQENLATFLDMKAISYFDNKNGLYVKSPVSAIPLLEESLGILAKLKTGDPTSRFWDQEQSYADGALSEAKAATDFAKAHPEETSIPASAYGLIGLASAQVKSGNAVTAFEYLKTATRELTEKLSRSVTEYDTTTYMWALDVTALALAMQGQMDKADAKFRESITAGDTYLLAHPQGSSVGAFRAGILVDWGKTKLRAGDRAGSIRSFAEARQVLERFVADKPELRQPQRDYYRALYHLADLSAEGVKWSSVSKQIGVLRSRKMLASNDDLLAPSDDESIVTAERRAAEDPK